MQVSRNKICLAGHGDGQRAGTAAMIQDRTVGRIFDERSRRSIKFEINETKTYSILWILAKYLWSMEQICLAQIQPTTKDDTFTGGADHSGVAMVLVTFL